MRLGQSQEPLTIDYSESDVPKQLRDTKADQADRLTELALLLKQDLITIDDYLKAKKELMGK